MELIATTGDKRRQKCMWRCLSGLWFATVPTTQNERGKEKGEYFMECKAYMTLDTVRVCSFGGSRLDVFVYLV